MAPLFYLQFITLVVSAVCKLYTEIELTVSASTLADIDTFSKSDPFCVLSLVDTKTKQVTELGRTEVKMNELNPTWTETLTVEYVFEENKTYRFVVNHATDKEKRGTKFSELGRMECSAGQLLSLKDTGTFAKALELPVGRAFKGKSSKIEIVAKELPSWTEYFTWKLSANELASKDPNGLSDPYVLILRKANANAKPIPVFRTETIMKSLDPTWKIFSLPVRRLTAGDPNSILVLQVWDWDQGSSDDFIGEYETTFNALLGTRGTTKEMYLENNRKVFGFMNRSEKDKKGGYLFVDPFEVTVIKTFLYYINLKKVELNFGAAIDFTSSNGHPTNPGSLHYYLNPDKPNPYIEATTAVGGVVEPYDFDKQFPALGFGAKINGTTYDSFFLDLINKQLECDGISGIIRAYNHTVQNVTLSGPTNFSRVINEITTTVSDVRIWNKYVILLIITDGEISDMPDTISAIIRASRLAMSIIIVGVGSGGDTQFENMRVLDSDDVPLTNSRGEKVARDIVQFVKYNDHLKDTRVALARVVLEEVPDQLTLHMKVCHPDL